MAGQVTPVWLACCSVAVLALTLAWDAFRRLLADRASARALKRQEGASTDLLDGFQAEGRKTWQEQTARLDAFEARLLTQERKAISQHGVRR